jgi:hypothetical protein
MDAIELERFNLIGSLGLGANYEVYAATDSETGRDVVLKRPWLQTIRGGQSRHVDEQSERVIELHQVLDGSVPYISQMVGYTKRVGHGGFFGDDLQQEYYVLAEERAYGLPLVADIRDKFRGVPIGLGQNLFALYPLVHSSRAGAPSIFAQLLDVEEAFSRVDRLIMDLRPQNVFFDPRQGTITVIDIGMCVDQRATSGRQPALDIHDCLAELCKFYLEPQNPPREAKGYRDPFGMGPPLGFSKELDRMIQADAAVPSEPLRDFSMSILQRLKRRDYGAVEPFRQDLQHYLALLDERNHNLPELPELVGVWYQGMALLREKYWRKFRFDPDSDLDGYV